MANEFKVKNGIKFPDGTTQTTAATGGGGGSSVVVSDTAPASPSANDLWWDSTIGQLRIYYVDTDTSQWVDAVNTQGIQGPTGPQGIQGTQGVAGPTGPTGPSGKTILYGTVNPSAGTGSDGDFYINTASSFIFGPKAAGVWPTGTDLKGADGVGIPTGGTTGQVLSKTSSTNYAVQWSTPSGGGGASSIKTTAYTSGSGTFTRDANTLFAQVFCTGGGGGGGGSDSDGTSMSASGGGGGGGTSISWYTAAQLGATAEYSIGTGGTAGSTSGGTGGTGGTSSFNPAGTGTTATGTGGGGGTGTGSGYGNYNGVFNGGSGGAGTGGYVISNGVDGSSGFGYGTSTTTGSMMAGNGGSSFWGGGGNGPTRNNSSGSQAGVAATTEGAGGSGAVNNSATAGVAGGAGANGAIVIIEYLGV